MPERTERELIELLERQLRDVRAWTKKMTDRTPGDWLWRRVGWTDNTIGWHMGHLAWEQDVEAAAYFGASRLLDAEWDRLFGFGCEVYPPDAYPDVARIRTVFDVALRRFLEQLGQVEQDDALTRRPLRPLEWTSPDWTLLNGVVNIIFHEGEHSSAIGVLLAHFEREGRDA